MYRLGHLTLAVTLGALLAACNHPTVPAASNTSIAVSGPTKPAATADENTWGNYLAEQGKLHGKDVGMRPYIYVIPADDSVAATARRQNETDSVVHGIGPILMPGGMLIVGGPDPKQTTAFLGDVAKQVKVDALKGIVVMVVSDGSEQATAENTLKASGATVRFVTM
ncbi:Lipoprotein [Burkholderia pseudomallei]